MRRQADVLVVGAGLAGLSTAIALADKGLRVIVTDKHEIASGASGVPIGLVNPAAAKQANLSWHAKHCMAALSDYLDRAAKYSDKIFCRKTGVLRPSADQSTLEAFRSSLTRHAFPSGWAKWMDTDEADAFHPGLTHTGGALWIPEGYSVDVATYLSGLASLLHHLGSEVVTHCEIVSKQHDRSSGAWIVHLSDGTTAATDHIVYAVGSSILRDDDWNWMPVHPIKGQMALYHSSDAIGWTHAVAARGYIAHLNHHDWVIGSTFEHSYKSLEPDTEGLKFLEEKVDSVLPELRPASSLRKQWSGVRLGTPNRLPVVGRHPSIHGNWLFAGLGSKGLLFSAYIGQLLASAIVDQTELPHEIDIQRLKPQPRF